MKNVRDTSFKKKNGTALRKREIFLLDNSVHDVVTLQLFDDNIHEIEYTKNNIITLRKVKIGSYNNKIILQYTKNSSVEYGSEEKIEWNDETTNFEYSIECLPVKNIVHSMKEALTIYNLEKIAYLQTRGMIININMQEKLSYMACPILNCTKRVVKNGTNNFHCTKCDLNFSTFKHLIMLKLVCSIEGKQFDIISFNDTSIKLLQITNEEFHYLETFNQGKLFEKLWAIEKIDMSLHIKLTTNPYNDSIQYILEDINRIEN